MPGWGERVQAAQQAMQAQRGLPERLANAEQALCDIRDAMAGMQDALRGLPEQIGQQVRIGTKGSTRRVLVGTAPVRVDDVERVIAISAYVVGPPVAAPGIQIVIDGDTGAPSPTFQQTISGPVQSPGQLALLTDPGVPVVVDLLTSWVGGWQVW